MSDLSDTATQVSAIRAMIARHKRWDVIFSMIGLAAMLLGAHAASLASLALRYFSAHPFV